MQPPQIPKAHQPTINEPTTSIHLYLQLTNNLSLCIVFLSKITLLILAQVPRQFRAEVESDRGTTEHSIQSLIRQQHCGVHL